MAKQQIDPARVLTPTQLIAAVLVLLVVAIPGLITGAATVGAPAWLPATFGVAAVLDVPLALLFIYKLLTRHRQNITSDEIYERVTVRAFEASLNLDRSLGHAGIDYAALITGVAEGNQQVRDDMAKLLSMMAVLRDYALNSSLPPEVNLNAARALMVERQWSQAAEHFDRYVRQVDADWEIQYARGVAHANTRGGVSADLFALRAYGEAVALAPASAEMNFVARLFAYRGAMAKRLGRLDQAEADLLLARRRASASYEIIDISYNLACVYALGERTSEALAELRQLRNLGGIALVYGHLDDYFQGLRDHGEFKQIVDMRPS